ncbi:MAG: phospho-sugar mutase [Clostridia bacterium]|nr:phospho-sugar mutase [Clostridia bacterium]
MSNYKAELERWLSSPAVDEKTKEQLRGYSDGDAAVAMNGYMKFGTAGLRAKMGAGTALMNTYTVAHATQGLAALIKKTGPEAVERGVAIAYDSRNNSDVFSKRCAEVLSANGIKCYIYPELRPTPCLSFALRELGCIAGINVTASHNPAEYNGYKVYWEDGAQIGPEQADVICDAIAEIDIFDGVPAPEAARPELIETIGENIDKRYIEEVLAQRVNPQAIPNVADSFSIVYTPLHGAGITMVPEVLRAAGVKTLSIVEEQAKPDGNFPTLRFPNPEFPEAFTIGAGIANEIGSELIVATDPDADRVGVMAKDKSGEFKCISGNQMGALILDYIITAYKNTNTMPDEPYAVKSIVSTALAEKICTENGVKMYDVLTGFKFIGEVIKNHLAEGHGTFLLGFEESYGYLKGTYARDKDAVVASLLICEMAAYYKERGMTLCDAREELFEKYGYYLEKTENFSFDTPDGAERMAAVTRTLRENVPCEIAGKKVLSIRDYKSGKIVDTESGKETETGLPSSDILYYTCDGCITVVRPSGTEPKLKMYFMANGKSIEEAEENIKAALASMKEKTGI